MNIRMVICALFIAFTFQDACKSMVFAAIGNGSLTIKAVFNLIVDYALLKHFYKEECIEWWQMAKSVISKK